MKITVMFAASALFLCGCAATEPELNADLEAVFAASAAAEMAYAAHPGADPAKVAEAHRLLIAAQAALLGWEQSKAPSAAAAAQAAAAALAAYVAAAPAAAVPAVPAAPAPGTGPG